MPGPSSVVPWPASLSTARLLLCPVEPRDLSVIARLWTDPEVRRYLGGPVTAGEAARRERECVGVPGSFSVLSRTGETPLGLVTVRPDSRRAGQAEVSYQFLPEHWGYGYAREAVRAATAWALEQITPPPAVVIAVTQQANRRSRRLLESIGMTLAGSFVEFGEPQVKYSVDRATLRP